MESDKSSKKFKWFTPMIGDSILALKEYETLIKLKNYGFNAGKLRQYEEVQKIISKKYPVLIDQFFADVIINPGVDKSFF